MPLWLANPAAQKAPLRRGLRPCPEFYALCNGDIRRLAVRLQERCSQARAAIEVVEPWRVPGAGDHLERRARDRRDDGSGDIGLTKAVVFAPDEQRRRADSREQGRRQKSRVHASQGRDRRRREPELVAERVGKAEQPKVARNVSRGDPAGVEAWTVTDAPED